jgi:hypothetical protein
MKDFQTRILQTVYYALGTVGAIALLLVGYNWWSANKIYDRDKNALKEEIFNAQDKKHLAFDKSVTERINAALTNASDLEQRIVEKLNTGLTSSEEKYLKFNEQASEKLTAGLIAAEEKYLKLRDETGKTLQTFRGEIDAQLRNFVKTSVSDLDSTITRKFEQQTTKHDVAITTLQRHLRMVQFDLNESFAKEQEKHENYGMAYTYYFNSLKAAIELDWEFLINPTIDSLIRILKKGCRVLESEKLRAKGLAKEAPDKYKEQMKFFLDLVEKAPAV